IVETDPAPGDESRLAQQSVGNEDRLSSAGLNPPMVFFGLIDGEGGPLGRAGFEFLHILGIVAGAIVARRPNRQHKVDDGPLSGRNDSLDFRDVLIGRRKPHGVDDWIWSLSSVDSEWNGGEAQQCRRADKTVTLVLVQSHCLSIFLAPSLIHSKQ